mmetsp:Transcript_26598/g.57165  ORF Transcript_26598/g.57165 Transcript_26598/m.57165 type:complete len:915 (+) Transcript_26598:136-2880(+)|eukprot:CAMPEP_0172321984 /NCGR_PEP_ID=MMETSP1058-20130122/44736_1 /TAXON_ID=83371 /ORGANISM="Detonula confervacea, Strain CCMP 353" /LENGTH=914 /DNA_ID=CAMNT_0013037613 /DNA_START=64 /DNA_END=2808 /DNA_ORIENTATION=-
MGRTKEPQIIEGKVNNSDDEEIDEDEAFNSEDELMYGEFFTSKKKSKKQGKSSSGDNKLKASGDDDSDDSDEESHESANGSEDDGSGDSGSDENDWAGSSDDSEGEEDDGGQYMLNLLNNLDGQVKPGKTVKGEGAGKISLSNVASEAAVRLPESEFQSSALSAMGSNGDNDGKLTLDSLMGGIADTAGFASVQKSMRVLSSGGGGRDDQKKLEVTAAPVSRVVSDRASRKVHYQSTTDDVTQWKDAVHEQRDAETLDFRTNKGGATTNRVTRDTLVEKFEATNDFEKELQSALEQAGMEDEKEMSKREKKRLTGEEGQDDDGFDEDNDLDMGDADDDLGSNRISMKEYKKRHGELAKLRALMFYEEQKRNRINKIKSKKYRKIRKRREDRLKDAEDEAALLDDTDGKIDRERVEQEEMDRMKERMTLAHKNTSKWARRVLRRGAKMDVEERRALSLQIAKGEELRRKVMGGEDGESGSEEETEEDLLKKARNILMEDDGDNEGSGAQGKKGLFTMEFMKRGMETQRTRAKEEARKLLEELEANEMAAMSSESEDDDYDKSEKESAKKKQKVATEAETNKVLPEGKLVASSLQFGKGDGFAIKVNGNIELGDKIVRTEDVKEADAMEDEQAEAGKGKRKRGGKKNKKKNEETKPVPVTEEVENPWIVSKSAKKSTKPLSRTVNINEAAAMLVDDAQDDKNVKRKQDDDKQSNDKKESEETTKESGTPTTVTDTEKDVVGVAELSQAELVRRAFASPADLEAEEEFQKEKERMSGRDDPTRKKKEDKVVTGWGSWAGAGAPPPRKPRKLPPKLRAPASKKANKSVKRKDDGMSTVIINEKRLKKNAKFQLSEIPYPYKSRAEYEKAIAGNIGQEWNTIHGTKEMSRPAVLFRTGKIIQPIGKKAKNKPKRAPAKF